MDVGGSGASVGGSTASVGGNAVGVGVADGDDERDGGRKFLATALRIAPATYSTRLAIWTSFVSSVQ